MSNPDFTAPDYTTQDAATYKANIDAAIAANGGDVVNLGFSYSAGTFTVHGHEGTALASTNPGFVRFQDPDNPGYSKYISVEANQNFIDDAGASEIINNLFGFPTGVAVSATRFYLYAVSNDAMSSVAFMLSRQPHRTTSPTAANIGAPDDAVADEISDFWALDNLDETLYDSNPCVCIGSIRMAMSTSDDWTVQALDATDGIGANSDRLNITHVIDDSTSQATMPLQTCFSVQPSADLDNVTGDGTLYTVVWASEITDQNSDFDGTSTFTAPVTGNYQLNVILSMHDIAAAHTKAQVRLVTSNRTYRFGTVDLGAVARASTADASLSASVIADMDAGDTAVVQLVVENSTKVIDIEASNSFFSGQLIS